MGCIKMERKREKGDNPLALGKGMRFLLIALDVCLIAYIVSHMIYRLLPITEPVFWVGAVIEIGLALLAFRYWMRSLLVPSWNSSKTLTIILVAIAIAWPLIVRYSDNYYLLNAAPADLLFFWAALTLLIYSSFIIKNLPLSKKSRT
jgi:hypothetical protein